MVEVRQTTRLAEATADLFHAGMVIDKDLREFIDSTCCARSAGQIRAILEDPENSDREMLLQLIFSPDVSVRISLEPFLENLAHGNLEVRALVGQVLSRIRTTRIHLPEPDESFGFPLDDFVVAHFLSSLNPGAVIDPKITDALRRFEQGRFYWPAKAALRNSRSRLTGKQAVWMVEFLSSAISGEDGFMDYFHFALEFASTLTDETEGFTRLIALKTRYLNALRDSDEFESRMFRSNKEILMAWGMRAPYVDKPAAMKKVSMIDHLCMALYGRIGAGENENNLFTIFGRSDMEKA